MTTTDSATFSTRLRERTRADHDSAETSQFMTDLLDGQLSRERYAELVAQLSFVYSALEAASDAMRADPIAGGFVSDSLRRSPAIAADLEALLGVEWSEQIAPSPATEEYCDRIREVCFTWPGGFVAHHYTRYLGDLSGGQVIGAIVRRVYDLPRDAGAALYEFPWITDKNAFRAEYRERLDTAPWDVEEQERVVDEIVGAYAFNVRDDGAPRRRRGEHARVMIEHASNPFDDSVVAAVVKHMNVDHVDDSLLIFARSATNRRRGVHAWSPSRRAMRCSVRGSMAAMSTSRCRGAHR